MAICQCCGAIEPLVSRAAIALLSTSAVSESILETMRLRMGFVAAAALLAGCKIVQTSTSGGSIVSASGDHDCAEENTCEIDIPNGDPFSETFTAVTRYGYAFAGWRGTESYLCAGSAPACTVDIPGSITAYDATGYMTAEFYHQPELIYPGMITVEYGIWSADVTLESGAATIFAGDFDGDGDDDVVFTAGTYPGEEFIASRQGAFLINEGNYSFTVAEGDRPDSVHPREVLMADFNGDGRNDFFIADHGYDVDPFPGWSNQLLLATETGYDDASDRLPDDSTGFTHNAAVGDVDGDGDIDILVANNGGEFLGGAPYLLLNDGSANFTVDQERLPERVVNDNNYWPWAADMPDLDSDGHVDLLMGGKDDSGQSYIHWGPDFDELTVLPASDYFVGFGGAVVISTAVHDIDGDGRTDILLGGYNDALNRGLQVLINAGDRTFVDQTQRRLGRSAWSPHEEWHREHRFLDFNGDGTLDIVPQQYAYDNGNVLAWLNDGTGHYVALKTTMFSDAEALFRLTWGVKVREGEAFKSVEFFTAEDGLRANAGVVMDGAQITLATAPSPPADTP